MDLIHLALPVLALIGMGVVAFVKRRNPVLGATLETVFGDVQALVAKLPLDPAKKATVLTQLLGVLQSQLHAPAVAPPPPPQMTPQQMLEMLLAAFQAQPPGAIAPAPPTPVVVAAPAK